MTDPSDFWFWALVLGVAVLGGGLYAFRWLHVARLVEDTPTSRIRSAAQGYVELAGRFRMFDGTRNLPRTRTCCRRAACAPPGARRSTATSCPTRMR